MGIVDDLKNSVKSSKEKIASLANELNDFVKIKDNIHSLDGNLQETIKKIDDLVDAFKKTNDSFTKVAESFQESAEILKKTDPAKLIKNQNDLNEKIKLISENIKILEKKIDNKKGLIFG